jgi:hypothetical protein
MFLPKDCSIAKESPAEKLESLGTLGRLEDKGDYVEVEQVSDGYFANETYFYFKSKAACDKFFARLHRAEKREEERLDQYR